MGALEIGQKPTNPQQFDLLKWIVHAITLFVVLGALYGLITWRMSFWTTDIYGRPIHYWQDLQKGISEHPEWLAPNNWGNQFSGGLAWIAFGSLLSGSTIQHLPWWKNRKLPDLVDVPWQYVVGVLPILFLCMAAVGVGANRAGIGYEQTIPIIITPGGQAKIYQSFRPDNGTRYELEISNYVYHSQSHKASAFSITAMLIPWNLSGLAGVDSNGKPQLSMRKEWLLWLCIMIILFAYWENIENANMHAIGGPKARQRKPSRRLGMGYAKHA